MISFSVIFFSIVLALTAGFLAVKYIEIRRGRVFFPRMRDIADVQAIATVRSIRRARTSFERLPLFLWVLLRALIRWSALAAARLARTIEERAYHLADFVSHKHGFERRETHSRFLKEALEMKNGKNGAHNTPRV